MIIQSTKVYYQEKIQPLQIEIVDGYIKDIYCYKQFKVDKDYGNNLIMPGMIDIHNHGYLKGDCHNPTDEWLETWTKHLPEEGVTSTLASISSYPKEGLIKAMNNIGKWIDDKHSGANILGVYSEGPFICSGKERGAQSLESQIIPTKEVIDEFIEASHDHLIYVMLAPEMLNDDYSVIDYCRTKGIAVALGHTAATYEICSKAIEHGVTSFTHTYNGMRGLHHREPGVVGSAMYYDQCYTECICDGVHVHKVAANILARTKGKDKFILITDSVNIKGLPLGKFVDESGVTNNICEDGVGRLDNGTICGSCHQLNEVLRYAIEEANIPIVTCLNAVTINPMRLLGINDRGLIAKNYIADIAVLDDKYQKVATYIAGQLY